MRHLTMEIMWPAASDLGLACVHVTAHPPYWGDSCRYAIHSSPWLVNLGTDTPISRTYEMGHTAAEARVGGRVSGWMWWTVWGTAGPQ